MNIEKYKERLLAREKELIEEAAHFDAEARNSYASEVEDPTDAVTSDESKAANFQLGDAASAKPPTGTRGLAANRGRHLWVLR